MTMFCCTGLIFLLNSPKTQPVLSPVQHHLGYKSWTLLHAGLELRTEHKPHLCSLCQTRNEQHSSKGAAIERVQLLS